MKKAILLFFSLLSLTIFAQPKDFYAKVTAVKDGDTVKVLYEKQEYTVRLSHIDCPEKKQDFGTKAKQRTSDLCFEKNVWVQSNGKKDRNGRILGEIIVNNRWNVNKILVEEGLAWHYKKFSKDTDYSLLEENAQIRKVGVWSMKNPIAPWDWRKGVRY